MPFLYRVWILKTNIVCVRPTRVRFQQNRFLNGFCKTDCLIIITDFLVVMLTVFFIYVDIMFTNRLCLDKMAENMADKGHRVLMKLLSAISENECIPYKIFFKIFDSKIASILLFDSEIWGLTYMQCTESVHVAACKRFLNVPKYACNNSV